MGERSKPSGSLGRERVVEAPPPAATAVLFYPVFAFSPTAEPGPRLRPYRKVHPTLHSPRGERKMGIKTWDIVVIPFTPFNSTKLEANHVFSCIKSVRLYEIEVLLA